MADRNQRGTALLVGGPYNQETFTPNEFMAERVSFVTDEGEHVYKRDAGNVYSYSHTDRAWVPPNHA